MDASSRYSPGGLVARPVTLRAMIAAARSANAAPHHRAGRDALDTRAGDELLEEPRGPGLVCEQLLGVALDSDHEGVLLVLDRLHDAVGRTRGHTEAGGDVAYRLVVDAVHLDGPVAHDAAKPRARGHL